jgi:Domain of unknown function (DUF397)
MSLGELAPRSARKDSTMSSSRTPREAAGPVWLKAHASTGAGACVQLAEIGGMIGLRDSKNPDAAPHLFSRDEIRAFFCVVKMGEFDHLVKVEDPEPPASRKERS